jgi:hypothetical protein
VIDKSNGELSRAELRKRVTEDLSSWLKLKVDYGKMEFQLGGDIYRKMKWSNKMEGTGV